MYRKSHTSPCGFRITLRGTVSRATSEKHVAFSPVRCQGRNNTFPSGLASLQGRGAACTQSGEQNNINVRCTYYGSVTRTHTYHHPAPEETVFRKVIEVELVQEAQSLRAEGGVMFRNILNYMEKTCVILLCRDSIRRRLRYASDRKVPRTSDVCLLIQNLTSMRFDDADMRIIYNTGGTNGTLSNFCWSFGEWHDAYMEHGITTGVNLDGKAVANRYGQPLFQITGRTNCGRIRVNCMGFLQAESSERVHCQKKHALWSRRRQ